MSLANITPYFVAYIIILAVVLLASTLWYYKCFVKPFAKFPSWRLEFRIPYWVLSRRPLDIVFLEKAVEQTKKYESEGLFAAWFFKPVVVVYGEENVKTIIHDPYATSKPSFIKLFEFAVGKSIFVSDGELWKRQQKMISPAFYPKALRMYTSFMNKTAKALVQNISERKGETIVDMSHFMGKFTLRLFYESSLGVREGNSKEEEETVETVQRTIEFAVSRFFRPWLYSEFALRIFPYARHVVKLEKENRKIYIRILEQLKESVLSREQSQVTEDESDDLSSRPKSIGEILIEDRLKLPSFSMEDLATELNVLIIAGFDSSAHTLMWTFFSLGLYPEIQERVYEEIANLTDEDIQYSDVQDLTYLDCVLKESLRLYAPPLVGRHVKKNTKCGNYLIPKNTDIIICPFTLHRNPDIYPEPEKYNPERFMDKNSKIKPWHHIPFMEGSRPCLGKKYAMLLMKIFLIHVLRNFKVITLDRKEDIIFKWSLILCPATEPRIKFVPRH